MRHSCIKYLCLSEQYLFHKMMFPPRDKCALFYTKNKFQLFSFLLLTFISWTLFPITESICTTAVPGVSPCILHSRSSSFPHGIPCPLSAPALYNASGISLSLAGRCCGYRTDRHPHNCTASFHCTSVHSYG